MKLRDSSQDLMDYQASTDSSTACMKSTVNGFVSRKSAPVSVAIVAVSGLLSNVMNPRHPSSKEQIDRCYRCNRDHRVRLPGHKIKVELIKPLVDSPQEIL